MKDIEKRAAIEFYVSECSCLTREPQAGYGLIKKDNIVQRLKRALELAESLSE